MNIIAEKQQINKSFELSFKLNNAEGGEFLDYDLPYPNAVIHQNRNTVYLTWLIEGYFYTKTNQAYLNDIIARFLISFAEYKPERIAYKQKLLQNEQIHKLNAFKSLESIKTHKKIPTRADMFEDHTFWAIKLFAEDEIRQTGFIVYETLENFAMTNFLEHKEQSTIRAKCRSIWNWYNERDFELPERQVKKYENNQKKYEGTKMTRQENMKKIAEKKVDTNRALVINATSGLMKDIYKKKSGKWNIAKLSKDLNLARNTIYKYLEL